jgi:UDP-N-acetylglucosamine/UDP-N-acetylgalactosamine diphosphorylase
MSLIPELRDRFVKEGQDHVFQFYGELSDDQKQILIEQLSKIPVEKLKGNLQKALAVVGMDSSQIQPFSGPVVDHDHPDADKWRSTGLEVIRNGQVAALVLAGGQGTRLGFDGPKGCYDLELPSGTTLFQLLSERLIKLAQLASISKGGTTEDKVQLPLYVMTSPLNHDTTVDFFKKHSNFGLKDLHFFPQGMLPCLDNDGKILMEDNFRVAMAPDGNGGIYPALESCGMLKMMKETGIRYIHVFSIDNALCRPADPTFLGYCITQEADCGNKVVWKAHAHEKVGVLAESNGKPCIVEYSDITADMAERVDDNNRLVFGAGNICNHFYTLDFLSNVVLPNMENMYHVARKKIPYYDGVQLVDPESPNGVKLESFIFDVFPLSQKMAVMNVLREHEFAPVKNATGNDSPETARQLISSLSKQYMKEAGAKLQDEDNAGTCEVKPMTSYAGEGLEEFKDRKISCPFCV